LPWVRELRHLLPADVEAQQLRLQLEVHKLLQGHLQREQPLLAVVAQPEVDAVVEPDAEQTRPRQLRLVPHLAFPMASRT
jgi:hypothetical protein